jgi:outer membrane autotransporter protein
VNVSGTATIATGAILNVVKLDAPRFNLGTRYTVLSATGGRTGTYTLTGATRVSQFISVVGEYDATNAYLAVRQTSSFASVGGTPNQVAAATGVDNAGNGAAYLAIAYLPDAASARAAFDLVSGEIHASLRGIAFEDTRFVRDAVASRLQSAGDARRGFWMNGYGAWGDWDGDGNAADLSRNISGLFFGVDAVANERFNVGILGGFGNAEFDVGSRASEATARDFHLGAYAGFGAAGAGPDDSRAGGISGRVGLANMWRDVKTARTPNFPGYSETLRSSYDLSVFQVFGDVGYRFDLGAIGVEPFAGIAYVRVSASEFLEAGGSGALRSVTDDASGYWMTSLGGRAYVGLPVGGGRFGLTATGAWRHAGGDVNDPLAMRFASGPAFDISGVPIAEDSALVGAAITGRFGPRVEVEAGYSGQIGGGVSDHGIKANMIIRF